MLDSSSQPLGFDDGSCWFSCEKIVLKSYKEEFLSFLVLYYYCTNFFFKGACKYVVREKRCLKNHSYFEKLSGSTNMFASHPT